MSLLGETYVALNRAYLSRLSAGATTDANELLDVLDDEWLSMCEELQEECVPYLLIASDCPIGEA